MMYKNVRSISLDISFESQVVKQNNRIPVDDWGFNNLLLTLLYPNEYYQHFGGII